MVGHVQGGQRWKVKQVLPSHIVGYAQCGTDGKLMKLDNCLDKAGKT